MFRSLRLRRNGLDINWSDLAHALDAALESLEVDFALADLGGIASAFFDGFELDLEEEDILEACVGDACFLLGSPATQDGM